MGSKSLQEDQSPAASVQRLSLGKRSRRGSKTSVSSQANLDKDMIAQALDQIHTSASQSDTLTTFAEFTTAPSASTTNEGRGLASELVQGGLSGLYSRIRASVGGNKDGLSGGHASHAGHTQDAADNVSVKSSKVKGDVATPKGSNTVASSPVVVSTPISRLQSPVTTTFDESFAMAKPASSSNHTITTKASNAKSPLAAFPKKSTPSQAGVLTESFNTSTSSSMDRLAMDPEYSKAGNKSNPASTDNNRTRSSSTSGLTSSNASRSRSTGPADSRLSLSKTQPEHSLEAVEDFGEDQSTGAEDDVVVVHGQTPHSDRSTLLDAEKHNSESAVRSRAPPRPLTLRTDTASKSTVGLFEAEQFQQQHRSSSNLTSSSHSVNTAKRPPLIQVGPSHLPGYKPSRASSSDATESGSVIPSVSTSRRPTFQAIDEHSGARYNFNPATQHLPNNVSAQIKRKVLSREFWMRDENAKDCFYCGDTFSTFRRKHHCRTCGQIFDAKCTSQVPGYLFGQQGTLRVCKPCEAIIRGNDDDSSVFSDDDDTQSIHHGQHRRHRPSDASQRSMANSIRRSSAHSLGLEQDHTKIVTPTMGIPVSRRNVESKRRSAIIEFEDQPALARPSSSRSLRSLGGRPRSSSHKRHHSRHHHMKSLKSSYEDRAPFQKNAVEEGNNRSLLPAFHTDSIIDPDLAPFMSDEGSSEDEQMSIFAAINGDMQSPSHAEGDRNLLGTLFSAVKKGRSKAGDRSVAGVNAPSRDIDNVSLASSRHMRPPSRRRNMSIASISHPRPSPRRSKSNNVLKGFQHVLDGSSPVFDGSPIDSDGSKMTTSSAMHGKRAPAVELNNASLEHVRRLLRQMLQDAEVAHVSSWEKALIPILLQCTDDVDPDVHNGDDIDVRNYVKLKKIPGGRAADTAYVSGVVFTKNIALKSMPRSVANPRIVIVTFAIEYARHQQHFMSLEPVIAQEREYLRNLVNRIAALQPQVLLVQRNVSGLALQFLAEKGIAVAYNIKPSVLNAVSRCTQTRMISSVDKLSTDPTQLGRASSFDVKTYVHHGLRKTYIYISGCQPNLGCTIVLRGNETEVLRKVKRITEFMCYVVYNLKLETCLMRDEFVLIPSSVDSGSMSPGRNTARRVWNAVPAEPNPPTDAIAQASRRLQEQLDRSSGEPVPLSDKSSNGIIVPKPESGEAVELQSTKDEKSVQSVELPLPDDLPIPTFYSDMVEKHKTKLLSASPFVKFMQPYLLMRAREQERRLAYLKRLKDQYAVDEVNEKSTEGKFELVKPEMVHSVPQQASRQVREFLHAVHSAEYDKAMHNYRTQKRQWEAYIAGNINLFDPMTHQNIVVLYTVVSTATSVPCAGPDLLALSFYAEHDLEEQFDADCTLGQYVEDLCYGANHVCTANGCDRKLMEHHRQYVHGEGQISVFLQKYPSKIRGLNNTILMWSVCRICGAETQTIPMSESTWKYSFGKYLELCFWSSELHPRADLCPHDIHKNHVRYFGFRDLALRIQYDPISLYEVVVPRLTVTWKVDTDLRLKNEVYLRWEERLNRFMISVKARIKSINVESVVPEKLEACKAEVERLTKRANDEHDYLLRKLQEKYMTSRYYEIIPFNRAVRALHEKAIEWDAAFSDFEKKFFPSEKDIRRLAALQLRKLFLDRDESVTSISSIEESPEEQSQDIEMTEKSFPLTHRPSNISEQEAREMLNSVVEQHSTGPATPAVMLQAEKEHLQENNAQTEDDNDLTPQPSNVTSQPPPITTSKESVEREDIRHLDLAVPADFPELKDAAAGPSVSADSQTDVAAPVPEPLSQDISDKVEQLQQASPNLSTGGAFESRIPRLVDTKVGPIVSPPLYRAQSTPVATTGMNSSASSISVVNAPNGASPEQSRKVAETSRLSLAEAAKGLEKKMVERLGIGSSRAGTSSKPSFIPRSIPAGRRHESKVSTLAKHFEQLSREFERERLRERRQQAERSRQVRAFPMASSKPIVEIYRDVHEAVQERDALEDESQIISPGRPSADSADFLESSVTESTAPTTETTTDSHSPVERRAGDTTAETTDLDEPMTGTSQSPSDIDGDASDIEQAVADDIEESEVSTQPDLLSPTESTIDLSLELPKHEKTTLMKMLTSFWSERTSSGWLPLEYPLLPTEHLFLDSDIVVREDEPSSIIALALENPDYQMKLNRFRERTSHAEEGKAGTGAYLHDDDEAAIERTLLRSTGTNMKYEFRHGSVKATCKIFYAESFDALRRKCGVADRFVESLSRCLKWDSKGGKTKSLFLKTLDDRFVLKSLSPIEIQAFLKFAPDYFSFMSQTMFHGLPSVIAKMFGLFQVVIKNPNTGVEFNWFMLVMENLFYDRNPNRKFDLKGSMRNRKIHSTGEENEVLLDENMVEFIYESPLFVREHSKRLLKASVYNDTLFLSKQNVMDYSLMAGFDDERRELIVGIIDCIRTYTWDKKLESWIKDRGKNKPTITSPKDYRNRFRASMNGYVLQAPNCWHQFSAPGMRRRSIKLNPRLEGEDNEGEGDAATAV